MSNQSTTTKNALSAPSAVSALSAPVLTCNDCAFLIEEAGSDFLQDFISARFGFSAVYSAPEMWEGEDGNLYTLRDLVNDYNAMREDSDFAARLEEDEIECFDDFLDYQTAMGGFLRKLSTYYGFTVNGYDTGEYFEYIESAFDAAELFQQRGNMHKRIEIVRYVVSDNN